MTGLTGQGSAPGIQSEPQLPMNRFKLHALTLLAVGLVASGCTQTDPPSPRAIGSPVELNVEVHRRSISNYLSLSSGGEVLVWASNVPTGNDTSPFRSYGRLHVQATDGSIVEVSSLDSHPLVDPESPPQLAEGPDGALYLAWSASDNPESVWRSTGLQVARSDDGGRTWSEASRPGGAFGGYQNNHELHVTAEGALWVAWLDSRMAPEGERAIHVFTSVSLDGGGSWSDPSVVDPAPSCECCRVAIASGSDGTVYLGWRKRLEGGIRDIVVSRTVDLGASWSAPVAVHPDNWVQDYCPDAGPTLAVDNQDRLHVAWWTGIEGASGVKSVYSDDQGRSFSDPVAHAMAASSRASHVQLTRSGDSVALVWDDGALDIPRIAVVASNDRGRSWSEPIHLGAGNHTAAYPHAGFPEANTITVFWNERGSADQPSREPDHSGEVWVDASPGSATPRLLKQSVSLN